MSLELLKKYYDMGLVLVPLTVKDGEKIPLITYREYKNKAQDWTTLQGLYETYKDENPLQWAVYSINGIVCIDWDTPNDYEAFFSDVDTLTHKSPSGGYHCVLKTLVPGKAFNHMGVELKAGELCTIIGEGYTLFKDSTIKEIPDLEELLKKKMPSFKIPKEGTKFKLIEVLDKLELFPDRVKGKKEDWSSDCPLCGNTKKEGVHFYYYHNTNSWYCHKCKKGGNAVNFVMSYKDMKVKDAISYIESVLGEKSTGNKDDNTKIIQRSTARLNNVLYEQVLTKAGYKFVSFNNNAFEYHNDLIETDNAGNEIKYVPCIDEEVTKGAVVIGKEPIDYGTKKELIDTIGAFIYKWLDIPDENRKFYTYYIMQTYVFEKFHTIGYARALGDTGVGKTRFLDTIGGLCYKPMFTVGAIGAAPIFRILDKHRGTLIIDEANFGKTDETEAIITILNAGWEKGKPILRCNKDQNMALNTFDAFSPKVLATRKKFTDAALEARCYTVSITQTNRDDIRSNLDDSFFKEREEITSKLMAFRLKNINIIEPKPELQALFKDIEPRVIQKNLPLAALVESEPEALKEFIKFTYDSQEDLIDERQGSQEGKIALTILELYETGLESNNSIESVLISGEDIAAKLNEDLPEKRKTNSQKVGKMLKTLGFSRHSKDVTSGNSQGEKKRVQKRALVTDLKLIGKLIKRYTFLGDESYPKLKESVTSVTSTYGMNLKSNNNINYVTELKQTEVKNENTCHSAPLVTLVTLVTEIEKFGINWIKNNGQIDTSNKIKFCMEFCKYKGNGNTPGEIMKIVEKIYKITPENKITVEVMGEVSEAVIE